MQVDMGPGRLGARRAEGQLLIETPSLSLPLYTAAVTAIKTSSVLILNGKVVIFRFVSLLS